MRPARPQIGTWTKSRIEEIGNSAIFQCRKASAGVSIRWENDEGKELKKEDGFVVRDCVCLSDDYTECTSPRFAYSLIDQTSERVRKTRRVACRFVITSLYLSFRRALSRFV